MAQVAAALSAVIFYLTLHPSTEWLTIWGLILGGLSGYYRKGCSLSLGIALCVLPFLGEGALTVFLLSSATGRFGGKFLSSVLLVQLASLMLTYPFLINEISLFFGNAEKGDFIFLTRSTYLVLVENLTLFVQIVALSTLGARVIDKTEFGKGLAVGLVVSCLFAGLQYLAVHPIFFHNMSPFWQYAKRYSGTFSDPNAFAVVGAISFVLVLGRARYYLLPVAGTLLLNGSRTFVVGLLLAFGFRKLPKVALFVALAGFAIVFTPAVVEKFGSIQSRVVMAERAFTNFLVNPAVGTGYGSFYLNQESPDGWRDNAGNLYLQILTEYGALGLFIFLIVAFFMLKSAEDKVPIALFFLLFLTGAHFVARGSQGTFCYYCGDLWS